MASIFRRGLFWRVYLTLLASLVLVALLAAFLMHQFAENAMPAMVTEPGLALGALLPGKDAPRSDRDAALRRISAATRSRVAITDGGAVPIAAAQAGVTIAPAAISDPARPGARIAMSRAWIAPLADGRQLWIERPSHLSHGPHMLAMLLAAATAVGMVAFPVVSRLTRRLETLRSSLDAWGEGRLESRATVDGRDEIAAVAASFNAAADRVEELLEAHKTLLVHASHELRSPLARLRVAVEMYTAAPDPSLRPEIIRDIAELSDQVDEILFASRLEQAAFQAGEERVDCLELAAEEAARAGVSVVHPGLAEASFEVMGSSRLLRRLIRNLIENGVKHGGPPVEVELTRARAALQVVISVNDRGPGIPEAEAELVFEPFYRPSGRPETDGSWGLGLSIVRQIAGRLGGRVACVSRPGGGVSFVVTVPAASPQRGA